MEIWEVDLCTHTLWTSDKADVDLSQNCQMKPTHVSCVTVLQKTVCVCADFCHTRIIWCWVSFGRWVASSVWRKESTNRRWMSLMIHHFHPDLALLLLSHRWTWREAPSLKSPFWNMCTAVRVCTFKWKQKSAQWSSSNRKRSKSLFVAWFVCWDV